LIGLSMLIPAITLPPVVMGILALAAGIFILINQ
jgi:hypothetical protein